MPDVIALSLISDLALSVRVEEVANRLGFRVATVSTAEKAIGTLQQGRASLLVVHLSAAAHRAAEVIQAAKAAPYPVAVLIFGSPTELEAAGAAAHHAVTEVQFHRGIAQHLIACLDSHRKLQTHPERDR